MDDSAQVSTQPQPAPTDPTIPAQATPIADQGQAVVQTSVQADDPFSPPPAQLKKPVMPPTVSGPSKEHQPMATGNRMSEVAIPEDEEEDEPQIVAASVAMPTEKEVSLTPELQEAGVEVSPNHEQPKLTDEHKALGMMPAKDAVPVQSMPTGQVQLPISKQQMKAYRHDYKWYESFRWKLEEMFKIEHKPKRQ